MLCYVMWNLFTVGSLQFSNDSTMALRGWLLRMNEIVVAVFDIF